MMTRTELVDRLMSLTSSATLAKQNETHADNTAAVAKEVAHSDPNFEHLPANVEEMKKHLEAMKVERQAQLDNVIRDEIMKSQLTDTELSTIVTFFESSMARRYVNVRKAALDKALKRAAQLMVEETNQMFNAAKAKWLKSVQVGIRTPSGCVDFCN